MAVRQATRRYPDLLTFLREYPTTLGVGALVLPADCLSGEPAPELKVDLVLPIAGRIGPLVGQVVTTLPDGGVALRITEMPQAAEAGIRQIQSLVETVKAHLLETGEVVVPPKEPVAAPEEIARLQARIRELEVQRVVAAPAPVSSPGGTSSADGPAGPRARGLPVPARDPAAATLSGDLQDRSLRDALMALAVEKQTGILTMRRPDGRVRWGFWSKGGPVGWRTEPMEEQEVLGVLLYRANSLTKEQLAQSLQIMDRTGCRQGEALIEMGVCTFPQLVLMLQKQTDFVFQRALREREGSWTFHLLPDLPERFITPPLRVASILYRAMLLHTREMPAQDLAAALRPHLDSYVNLAAGVEKTFEEMKLTAEEAQFVQIIGKTPYRLREVFAVSSLSRSQTAAAVWCLYDLNLIELKTESSGVREREAFARNIASRLSAAKAKTAFERLELHWICTTPQVEEAYQRLKAEWQVDAVVAKHGEQYRKALVDINESLDGAYQTLANEAKRREYRATIIEKGKIEQSAELISKQGEMAIMKALSREATDCYLKALELVPNNAEYREGLARAKAIPRV